MLKKKSFIIVLCLLFISVFIYIIFNNFEQETVTNKQSIEAINKAKDDKIALCLVDAINYLENNNPKAQELAKLCLLESQQKGNKSLQMRSLYVIGRSFSDPDSLKIAQTYYDKALQISKEIKDNLYSGQILYRKAKNQYRLNNTRIALETFNEALYFSQISNDYKTIGATYSMIGTSFRVHGAYSRAIEYLIKSRLNYDKANFKEGDAWVTYLLGQVYSDLRNSKKAMLYFQESLNKYQVLASGDGNTNGIAMCYEQIALLNLESGNFNEANKNINTLLKIHIKNKSEFGISIAYSHLGKLEYLTGNYTKAVTLLNKSLKIKYEYYSLHSKPSVYLYLGLCAIKTGSFEDGIKKIEQGLEIALTNNFKKNQLEIYTKLADIYLDINNYKKAIFYKNKQIEIQNQILFGETDVQIEQLQTFYEIDEKNRQINDLKKENDLHTLKIKQQRFYQTLMGSLIIIAILIAVITYVFYYKLRTKNSELKTLNSTKNRLFSIISHDLRSPFNAIIGFSDLLKNNAKGLETTKIIKFSEHINSAAINTLALLDNLLNWAKSQTGQIIFKPLKLNLHPIITQTIDILTLTAELKNITLKYIQPSDIEVYADEHMLKTILLNLITNSVKFTNSNGNIIVNAFQKNNFVEITVSDDGIGMNNETKNKLFTLEVNETTLGTANEKGSGLGLVLCKDLVEKHGGDIWVVSEPNKGSTFHFTLPNIIVVENKSLNTNLETVTKKTPTILVVEDEQINYQFIEAILESCYSVVHAVNGKQGVELFNNNDIDLVLMDIKMPIMNGIEATKEIRKTDKKTPIIALTAYENYEEKVVKAGCNYFIPKPINRKKLIEIIKNHLKEI